MKYDFETVVPRKNVGSSKWDGMLNKNPDLPEDIIPFSVADMEFLNAPEISNGLQEYIGTYPLGYVFPTEDYVNSVVGWMKRRHNWDVKPEWLLNTAGVVSAFYTAVKAFTNVGDGVMIMTPVYYPFYSAISLNDRTMVETKLIRNGSRYEIDFDDFEKKAADPNTKLLLLCSPHNPCSRIWTKEELERMGQICIKHDVFIVSDEIHFDLVMPGYHHTVFASISDELADHCMVCTAPSKTFNLAGLETSNIFIPNAERRARYLKEQRTINHKPRCNAIGYKACELAYTYGDKWLDEAINVIAENKRIIEEFFAKEFPQIKLIDFEATYLLWMDWNGLGLDYKELERINENEAYLFFDEGYLFGEQGQGFERWNLACPTSYVKAALERMKKAYAPYLKK